VSGAVEALAEAVWGRIRTLALAADRLDRLPENPGGVAAVEGTGELLAREFVLRLWRVAADPTNYALLRRLVRDSSVPLVGLSAEVGLPPLAVAERVADLVQVGLAARSLVGDQVQATAAATAVVELVEAVQAEVARRVEGWAERP
jgi:hypothetical protein